MQQERDPTTGLFKGVIEEKGPVVIEALRDGCGIYAAALCAGLVRHTVDEWFARGEGRSPDHDDPRGIYANFVRLANEALGEYLLKHTKRLSDVAPDAAAASNTRFVLERRDPDWRRETKHDVTNHAPKAPTVIIED